MPTDPAVRRRIRAAMRHLLRALGHPRGRRGLLHRFPPEAPRIVPDSPKR